MANEIAAREMEMSYLRVLAEQYPTISAAIAEIARLSAVLTLPKGTIHVISDVHGEDKKLRHVINNASGTLRPLVEKMFAHRMSERELREFLTLIFYPAEVTERLEQSLTDPQALREYATRTLRYQLDLARLLASRYSLRRAIKSFPKAYVELVSEMLHTHTDDRGDFLAALVDELAERGSALEMVHVMGRLVRNLAVYELIIGGDCWDRGPRGDRVVDYLRQQPNVSMIWGNHDAAWLGAALGNDALMCTVLRLSLRYRRLAQIDEGYSIPLTPLDTLARSAYGNDPAIHFMPKAEGSRPKFLVARMQKAIAVLQFKLEGQMIERHPEWRLDHRRLLHLIDYGKGTITLDGQTYPLRDTHFPTIDPADPYRLTELEEECVRRLRHSFNMSQKLQDHMKFLVGQGSMYEVRDEHLIFHGCVPCDKDGNFLPMPIDGRELKGRELFTAIQSVAVRALEKRRPDDLDALWYLWSGPLSPLFGKDKIATFERDFIEDKHTHHETKDPYFELIHEASFCRKVLAEFGVCPDRGLIVNGHVPVKIEKGESPVKRSGKAITIDGAFSEAYGDHGFTLVLEADRTLLAKHHHFDSVETAIRDGVDIIPNITTVREGPVRRMSDTERGRQIKADIESLGRLIEMYRQNVLRQREV
ncbi:MAG TPA: fructose-bisphosphatase class III [Tepidisphaeraceae bacterium]|jgi:fructose-1,6-bisphosphatase-3|nr:fructose-bisphosphatase class III [Tepidisphaeraceae bacterium]